MTYKVIPSPITESHNKRANAYTHAHTEAERGQVSRLSEKQVEEREEVENKEREAEAKRSVLVAKIAQLHNLLIYMLWGGLRPHTLVA